MDPIDMGLLKAVVAENLWFSPTPGATFLVGSWARLLSECPSGKQPRVGSDVDVISIVQQMTKPWAKRLEFQKMNIWLAQRTAEMDVRFAARGAEHRCKIVLF